MSLAQILDEELNAGLVMRSDQLPRDDSERAIIELYKSFGRPEPGIVWCQSLYQLVTLPSLLIGIIHSDMWQVLSGFMLASFAPEERWRAQWNDGWAQLWAHGGFRLLRGMNETSRLGAQYYELETALMLQSRDQLAAWLKSGQLKRFEDQLNKELYRRFWAMHLWHKDLVRDLTHVLSEELEHELRRDAQSYPDEWAQFLPFQERFRSNYAATHESLLGLVARMGAEPTAQLRNAHWTPFGFPWPRLAAVWQKHVNADAFAHHQKEISIWNEISESVLAGIYLNDVAFVCEKPRVLAVDEWGRLHHESEAALEFSDGLTTFAWHSVVVDRWLIEEPDAITVDHIEECSNIEIRRVMMERYGQARYLQESGAVQVHEDDFGVLYRKEMPGDEPLVMVKVVNSTAEPDGTFRDYFLRVPPHVTTAKEAVAWTFEIEEDDYNPAFES